MGTMNETSEVMVSVNDFSVICRICLQFHNDMVDIFGCGIDNKLMEITKLKVRSDDKLPKTLCQNCKLQMESISLFQEKAQSSDTLLRSLLSDDQDAKSVNKKSPTCKLKTTRNRKSKRRIFSKNLKHRKKLKTEKTETEPDKMYLIVVPQLDDSDMSIDESKICIKDLTFDSNDVELKHYCQNLVNDYFVEHNYQGKSNEISRFSNLNRKEVTIAESEFHNNDLKLSDNIYKVNLFIFKCTRCNDFFEEQDELFNHCLIMHNTYEHSVLQSYECPVCSLCEINKNNFFHHLEKHKEEGCRFITVNPSGDTVLGKFYENNLFSNASVKEELKGCCNILKLCLDVFSCSICLEKFKSEADFSEHIQVCHRSEELVKYTFGEYNCPLCSYVGKKTEFVKHLFLHKKNNFYFIKVNSIGELHKLDENDEAFVSFEEAFEISRVLSGIKKIIIVKDVNSCDKCDYSGDSFQSLNEHYLKEHSMVQLIMENALVCPVCSEEIQSDGVFDVKYKLYDHLRNHKTEGMLFIEISRNGFVKPNVNGYMDLFHQSPLLYGLNNGSFNVDWSQVWYPECRVSKQVDCKEKNFNKKSPESIERIMTLSKNDQGVDSLNYICEKCGKTFEDKGDHKKHCATHLKVSDSGGKKPVCTMCNKTFANRTSLCSHIRNHIQEGDGNDELESSLLGIICDVCGKSFTNHTSLTKHKRVHKPGKENVGLKCEICNREFFRQSSYDRHRSAHFNPKYFDCDVCRLPLPSMVSLQKHAETHKSTSNTFDCKACKTSFLTKDSLTAHQTHTGHYLDRKPLECNVCHEKFFIGKKFTEHIKTHPKYKMGECTLCGKRLSTVQSLMLHMGRHFESNSILCPHCGKQFFEERNFHRHLLTHGGIKPFSCDVERCEKSFYTLFELNRHKKYHSNTRDFACRYCGKSFHEANHLTVHVRTHTGERPYTCPHCNKGFITRTRCKHHIKLVHQGVGYDLIQSNISKKVTVFEAVEAVL